MERINARHYAVYLERRVDDFGDAEQPVPRWTERDRDAIREVLRAFRLLDQHNILMAQVLRANEITVPALAYDEHLEGDSAEWEDLVPDGASEDRPWWRIW